MRDVDRIIDLMTQTFPDVSVEQIQVAHPGVDEDGIWFFTRPGLPCEVQLESFNGMCPFTAETTENAGSHTIGSVESAFDVLSQLLHLRSPGQPGR